MDQKLILISEASIVDSIRVEQNSVSFYIYSVHTTWHADSPVIAVTMGMVKPGIPKDAAYVDPT